MIYTCKSRGHANPNSKPNHKLTMDDVTLSTPLTSRPDCSDPAVTLQEMEQLRLEAHIADQRLKSFVSHPDHRSNDYTQHREQLAVNAMKTLSTFKNAMCLAYYN